jgi:membrane-bound acyltransferase YfiQ involved in biofilm formation
MRHKWFLWLSGFSFIIYVMHAPAVAIAIDAAFIWLHYIEGYRIIAYILSPVVLIILCIAIGVLLRKSSPAAYAFVTGERGLG